ncbi:MAG: hypothetical protein ACJAXT_001920 [Paracoccaceae bacterium]|jgi:uncharacterized protein YjiS (DUF1127 family)
MSYLIDIERTTHMAIVTNRALGAGFTATSAIARIVGRFAAWNDARVTRDSLQRLSARELEDLGLVRGDIDSIAQGTFRR